MENNRLKAFCSIVNVECPHHFLHSHERWILHTARNPPVREHFFYAELRHKCPIVYIRFTTRPRSLYTTAKTVKMVRTEKSIDDGKADNIGQAQAVPKLALRGPCEINASYRVAAGSTSPNSTLIWTINLSEAYFRSSSRFPLTDDWPTARQNDSDLSHYNRCEVGYSSHNMVHTTPSNFELRWPSLN